MNNAPLEGKGLQPLVSSTSVVLPVPGLNFSISNQSIEQICVTEAKKIPAHNWKAIVSPVANPDIEPVVGGGGGLFYLLCRLFFVLKFLLFCPK